MDSPEDVEASPEDYECRGCSIAARLDSLGPLNAHAWRTYTQAVTRLGVDCGATGMVLTRLLAPLDDEEFRDCWQRLLIVHDILNPPRTPKGAGETER